MKTLLTKLTLLAKDKKAWLALIAGLVLTFGYAPFQIWPIVFFSLAAIIFCINPNNTGKAHAKTAAKYGFIFGLGWFGAGISWVHVSIATFGGMPLIASLSLMAFLCAYLALFPALAFWAATRFASGPKGFGALLIVSVAMSEYLRGTVLTGFPWLSFGYTQTDGPLRILAPYIGEFGLTLACVAIAFAFYRLTQKDFKTPLITAAAFVILVVSALNTGSDQYSGKHMSTLLVQGNIKQHLRFEPSEFWTTMSKYQDLTRPHWDADLIVWPEAAVPEIEMLADTYLANLDRAASFNKTALVTGIVDYQLDTKTIYNTLIVVGNKEHNDEQGHYRYLDKNRYRKHQLLPIGEFVPFQDILRPIAPLFDLPMSSFTRGDKVQNNLRANGFNLLPAICYEIVFADLVRGNYKSDSDLLFTVSNDAWFGDSIGPLQHMQIARMRSLELQRPLVRVTNNGVSAVYDPISHTQQTMPQFEAATMKADIKLIQGDSVYSQYGNVFVWGFVVLLGVGGFGVRFRK
ncbi:apolipoprotein N-acyltransferase [Pseudoalteromonas carrageenovora]|uniref:apolipoprotein N-acyltransferase n=1 Tax=Pseudoalteromonas carrageenovora TaxID=227 RepID=UPI002119769C|nr:apolipoprotein N-acyltransferase [Pseudoalteromonas carrageenovora]MCQ8890017.1 apolipoprotein N-acyltransferase [Pseudoalteromonas carrageenovora]MDO6547564.1 apolipoprotein N-acyltransferase [Pseudoalteromonas carrageenovora]MDO6831876.1 apolipoprotein N-acyltransferase [Pseudoalteromonas carrageenovora]